MDLRKSVWNSRAPTVFLPKDFLRPILEGEIGGGRSLCCVVVRQKIARRGKLEIPIPWCRLLSVPHVSKSICAGWRILQDSGLIRTMYVRRFVTLLEPVEQDLTSVNVGVIIG